MEENTISQQSPAPHDTRAEIAVLGSMLLDTDALELCLEELQPEDFYDPAHQELFRCMRSLHEARAPVDVVSLVTELDRMGKLRLVGDAGYVSDLIIRTPSSANVKHYSSVVADRSIQRRLIRAGNDITRDAMNSAMEVDDMLSEAERRIYDISLNQADDTLQHVGEIVISTYEQMEALRATKGEIIGIPTGFIDLDNKTSGLKKSDLIIVAGRPAMGKTSFAINIAQHAALNEGRTVAIFSLEMSREQLLMRMFSTESRIDLQKILSGTTSNMEVIEIANHLDEFRNSKLYVDDSSSANVPSIRSKCRKLKAREGLDLIVIDYLQLMRSSRKSENRQQEVSEITRSLKILARELDVPIMLLSQLSRGPEQRAEHKPMLADLRESGAIEQDADIVMLLYREKVYDPDASDLAEVIIAKHRNGPTGTVELYWRGEYTRFENASRSGSPF